MFKHPPFRDVQLVCHYVMLYVMFYQIQTENELNKKKFRGIVPSLVKIWKEEGFLGYYKVCWKLLDIFATLVLDRAMVQMC